MTYTFAELEVSPQTFHEIATKLKEASYDHAFHEDGRVIDMHGIGLVSSDATQRVMTDIEVTTENRACGWMGTGLE